MIKISAIAPYVLAVTINALGISLSHATTNTPPPTSFSYDSLYDLLYAEIALYRGQVATALQKYSQYAPILNNEQVLERAVQIANFLQNSKQAFSLSQQWANAYPTQSKAFYQLAYNALKTQHYAQAMTAIDKLLALDPETDLEILFLSAYPNDPEQRTQLLNALSELEKSHPNNAHLLFAHALLIGENGNTSQALLFAEKAKKINPNSIPATLLQARLLQLNKQKTLALQTLAHALKTYPDSPQLNMHYIRALINNKNYTEAENNLAQFLLKNPLNTEALLMHALLSYDNQHNRSAIDSFNKLIELNSNANEAYYYLAMIAKRQHNLAQAESYLMQIEDGERYLNAQAELAQLRLKDQRSAQVKAQFNESRQRYPNIANTLYLLEAEILNNHKLTDEAYAVLEDALAKYPQDNSLMFNRALLAEKRNNLIQFETDMLELIRRDTHNASYLNAYGYTLANRTNRLQEADKLLRAAIKLKPNDPAIMDSVGWLLYKQGYTFEGLTYIKKAFAASSDEEIGLHLAEMLWVSGYKTEATHTWQKLLKQNPNSEEVIKHRLQWKNTP